MSIVTIDDLPDEILSFVFEHLDPKAVPACGLVSKRFYAMATDNSLWQKFTLRDSGEPATVPDNWYSYYREEVFAWTRGEFSVIHRFAGFHQGTVRGVAYNGRLVSTAGHDSRAAVWSAATGERVAESTSVDFLWAVDMNDSNIVLGGREGQVTYADTNLQEIWKNKSVHTGPVMGLRLHGNELLTAAGDRTCKLWDVRSQTVIATFAGHEGEVNDACMDENYVFSAADDARAIQWDKRKLDIVVQYKGHSGWVKHVSVTARRVFTCGDDETFRMYDRDSGEQLSQASVGSWAFCSQVDARKAVVSTSKGQVVVFSYGGDELVARSWMSVTPDSWACSFQYRHNVMALSTNNKEALLLKLG
eukprot:TRINITY_DN10665_c0_g1_i1.p1 TRINITY_DN10665_c0_g1~~TRINITY_DN10665_c0_g1_i1.p1  ORF type:complete len:361 (-),score=59.54 TRINITY_DN10665_c0_g1_i1:82-1164(-)